MLSGATQKRLYSRMPFNSLRPTEGVPGNIQYGIVCERKGEKQNQKNVRDRSQKGREEKAKETREGQKESY